MGGGRRERREEKGDGMPDQRAGEREKVEKKRERRSA